MNLFINYNLKNNLILQKILNVKIIFSKISYSAFVLNEWKDPLDNGFECFQLTINTQVITLQDVLQLFNGQKHEVCGFTHV